MNEPYSTLLQKSNEFLEAINVGANQMPFGLDLACALVLSIGITALGVARLGIPLFSKTPVDPLKVMAAYDSSPNVFRAVQPDLINDQKANGAKAIADTQMRLRLHILPAFGRVKASTIDPVAIE